MQLEAWAEHYRTVDGWPEQEVQAWLESYYASPDPPGFVAPQEPSPDEQTEDVVPAAEDTAFGVTVEASEVRTVPQSIILYPVSCRSCMLRAHLQAISAQQA